MKARSFLFLLGVVALVLVLVQAACEARHHKESAAADGVTVELERPKVGIRTFDPLHLPNPGPVIPPGLHAITAYDFHCYVTDAMNYIDNSDLPGGSVRAKIKPTVLTLRLTLDLLTWLPNDARPKLKEHEAGHVQIDSTVFEKRAKDVAQQVGGELIQREFEAEGPNLAEARQNANEKLVLEFCNRYHEVTTALARKADAHYDVLTKHGSNDVPTQEAVDKVLREDVEGVGTDQQSPGSAVVP